MRSILKHFSREKKTSPSNRHRTNKKRGELLFKLICFLFSFLKNFSSISTDPFLASFLLLTKGFERNSWSRSFFLPFTSFTKSNYQRHPYKTESSPKNIFNPFFKSKVRSRLMIDKNHKSRSIHLNLCSIHNLTNFIF